MKILVIGSGGREHALAWKISQSPLVKKIYTAPGNGGTAGVKLNTNLDIKATDIERLAGFALRERIDLTVVGPEDPLSLGIVDLFKRKGLTIFGPTKEAAMLESSKGYAKEFLKRNGIPTPSFRITDDPALALRSLDDFAPPFVIKADGLALGKGVKICPSRDEAENEIESMMVARSLGEAGSRIVIDEFIDGPELSFISISDGENFIPLEPSQDNKRLDDGDKGPNTGGMGAYSPVPFAAEGIRREIASKVVAPTLKGMRAEGHPFAGALYSGLIFRGKEPLVLEYNARFGDPETQPLLFRMKSDVVPVLLASADGNLKGVSIKWDKRFAICVVIASGGYPGQYKKGLVIEGPLKIDSEDPDAIVFHAGTLLSDGRLVTNGGRVLSVCVKDADPSKAKARAVEISQRIRFEGAHFRRDIGEKLLS